MTRNYPRDEIVQSLLDTLEVERHVRGPLLLCVVDELAAGTGLAPATEAARSLLTRVQDGIVGETEFVVRLVELRTLVRALTGRAADAA